MASLRMLSPVKLFGVADSAGARLFPGNESGRASFCEAYVAEDTDVVPLSLWTPQSWPDFSLQRTRGQVSIVLLSCRIERAAKLEGVARVLRHIGAL